MLLWASKDNEINTLGFCRFVIFNTVGNLFLYPSFFIEIVNTYQGISLLFLLKNFHSIICFDVF